MVPSAVLLGGGRGYDFRRADPTTRRAAFSVLESAKAADAQQSHSRRAGSAHWAPKTPVPRT